MEEKIMQFVQEQGIHLENKKMMVAVSGGPDSISLLHLFHKWKQRLAMDLVAITINHQLRADAEEDIAYVKRQCDNWKIPLIVETIDVKAYEKEHALSTQVAARELRYEQFAKAMAAENVDYLALGHHGDDQIETLIMSLMRSTTLASITGIPFSRPLHKGRIIRPLLAVTKEEIEQYCEQNKLHPRIDESNKDITYTRNYIRQLVVPKLKEKNHNLHVTIQQLAQRLQEDENYILTEAKQLFNQIVYRSKNEKKAKIRIEQLRELPISLQRRIYRLTLDYLYEKLPAQLSYSHERIFLSLLDENVENKRLHFPQGLIVEVVYRDIELYFTKTMRESFSMTIDEIPTTVTLPKGDLLHIQYTNRSEERGTEEFICPVTQLTFPLKVRTRRAGDRMRYRGLNGSKKIKDILIDEKIPPRKRDDIVIVTEAKDEILWLVGVRKGIVKQDITKDALYVSFTYESLEGDTHA